MQTTDLQRLHKYFTSELLQKFTRNPMHDYYITYFDFYQVQSNLAFRFCKIQKTKQLNKEFKGFSYYIGLSPNGKAQVFDSCICWFESN